MSQIQSLENKGIRKICSNRREVEQGLAGDKVEGRKLQTEA